MLWQQEVTSSTGSTPAQQETALNRMTHEITRGNSWPDDTWESKHRQKDVSSDSLIMEIQCIMALDSFSGDQCLDVKAKI